LNSKKKLGFFKNSRLKFFKSKPFTLLKVRSKKASEAKTNIIKKMPQLDLASFLPQVFWFILIFFSYYIIVVNNILPSLSRILKMRTKKLSQGKELVITMTSERNNLSTNYDSFLGQSLRDSGQFLQNNFNLSNNWISQSELSSQEVAQTYLGALENLSASQAILRNLSTKISPSILVENLSIKVETSNNNQNSSSLWE